MYTAAYPRGSVTTMKGGALSQPASAEVTRVFVQQGIEQQSGIHIQCIGNALDVAYAQVAAFAFDARDIGSVQVTQVGQRFLGELAVLAQLSHVGGEQRQ